MFFTRPIPIPLEDDFCLDPTCPDREDEEAINAVAQQVEDGLLTADEATRTVQGRQL